MSNLSREDRLELISRLQGNAAVEAARQEIIAMKREYEANLGRFLMGPDGTVSQREIDYKRGYWRGMLWAFTVLPKNAGPQLNKLLEKELAERGDSE